MVSNKFFLALSCACLIMTSCAPDASEAEDPQEQIDPTPLPPEPEPEPEPEAEPDPEPSKTRVSLIGDSISTFEGYMPAGYTWHYPNSTADVDVVEKTWWHRLIYHYMENAELDMNLSFSNTTVTMNQDKNNVGVYWYGHDFCSRFIECKGMGDPDVILIHGGTNDHGHNTGEFLIGNMSMKSSDNPSDYLMNLIFTQADKAKTVEQAEALPYDNFVRAYTKLVRMMQTRHPKAMIICIIGDSVGDAMQYCIHTIAKHYGCKVVDFYAINGFRENTYVTKYDAAHVHPDANGMDYMANKIYTEIFKE